MSLEKKKKSFIMQNSANEKSSHRPLIYARKSPSLPGGGAAPREKKGLKQTR